MFAHVAALHINISAKSWQMLNLFMPSRLFVGYTHHRAGCKLQHALAKQQHQNILVLKFQLLSISIENENTWQCGRCTLCQLLHLERLKRTVCRLGCNSRHNFICSCRLITSFWFIAFFSYHQLALMSVISAWWILLWPILYQEQSFKMWISIHLAGLILKIK